MDGEFAKSMADVLRPGKVGRAELETVEVDSVMAMLASLRGQPTQPGTFMKLSVGGQLVMSDTFFERRTNREFVWNARGNVLVAGLGMGLVLTAVLKKDKKNPVKRVTVVEVEPDVVSLVGPYFNGDGRLEIVTADIWNWLPPVGVKYDCVYFDIWANLHTEDLAEHTKLHRRFRGHLAPGGWMGSWARDWLRDKKRQESRQCW